jgi:predicted component of type VI protein secretion system
MALLRAARPGYLPAVEAVRKGRERQGPQLASLPACRSRLAAILQGVRPGKSQAAVEQQRPFGQPDARRQERQGWEIYEAFYKEVAEGAEQGFDGPFGREFRRAYEEQLKKL